MNANKSLKRNALLKMSAFLISLGAASLLLAPTAQAAKCAPGQYGLLKCVKCPAGTYAYKDVILTSLGCKKCPSGTSSQAGSRACTDNPCSANVHGKRMSLSSGKQFCSYVDGKNYQCYRGSLRVKGACRVCQARDHQGYSRNYAHGKKRCGSDQYWYTCQDGSWKKGGSCKTTRSCAARTGLVGSAHNASLCNTSDRFLYKCNDGRWVKGAACPKRGCKHPNSNHIVADGAKLCKDSGRVRGEKSLIQCADGAWKVIKRGSCQ